MLDMVWISMYISPSLTPGPILAMPANFNFMKIGVLFMEVEI